MKKRKTNLCVPPRMSTDLASSPAPIDELYRYKDASDVIVRKAIENAGEQASSMSRLLATSFERQKTQT